MKRRKRFKGRLSVVDATYKAGKRGGMWLGGVINFVHLTRIQNDPPLLLHVGPRIYGGFSMLLKY